MNTIHKIGAIILQDNKILVAKKKTKYIIPGGRLENESHEECLRRELMEELEVKLVSYQYFGTFADAAALDPGMRIQMEVYRVNIEGQPKASSEIEEIQWVGSDTSLNLGSILYKFVIPELKSKGLIE